MQAPLCVQRSASLINAYLCRSATKQEEVPTKATVMHIINMRLFICFRRSILKSIPKYLVRALGAKLVSICCNTACVKYIYAFLTGSDLQALVLQPSEAYVQNPSSRLLREHIQGRWVPWPNLPAKQVALQNSADLP